MEKQAMLAKVYGIAMPARMDIEAQILSRCVTIADAVHPALCPLRSIASTTRAEEGARARALFRSPGRGTHSVFPWPADVLGSVSLE